METALFFQTSKSSNLVKLLKTYLLAAKPSFIGDVTVEIEDSLDFESDSGEKKEEEDGEEELIGENFYDKKDRNEDKSLDDDLMRTFVQDGLFKTKFN